MFSKKLHADVRKSTQKIQDLKKDSATRLKHLKIVLENVDVEEAKTFFESNFSHIYYILYDSFVAAETNLRQRELSFHLVHKAHREELECVLHVLEKVLVLLPEQLGRRWQCHSLSRLACKLLHPGNSWKLRREGVRFFLLWYQALGDNAPDSIHAIFATLVPGFPSPIPGCGLPALSRNSTSVFHDSSHGPVNPVEIQPLLPPQSGEKPPEEDVSRYFLEALLEFMVTQVVKIEWRDKVGKQGKCFNFLFEKFKQYYLPHIFPQFSHATSIYKPVLDLPELRKAPPGASNSAESPRKQDPLISCRVAVIKWVSNYTHVTKKRILQVAHPNSTSINPSEDADHSPGTELRRVSVSQAGASNHDSAAQASDSNHSSLFSHVDGVNRSFSEDPNVATPNLVRDVLYSTRENVDFVHEIYRQAFLLNFTQSEAIRKTISVYKDWIVMNIPELPPFMLEPLESHKDDGYRSGPPSYEYSSMEGGDGPDSYRMTRLRNDSYLGAIHRENLLVRAGLQNLLQVFITYAANVFMLEVSPEYPMLLEEQVDMCKRVLNIYRYMVMNTRMESRTWEQLLLVLLHITSLVLSKTPPKRKEETLGGKLAPAIFQTLIVTWIKANLNVVISSELWDQFLIVLSSLTQWEELIKEWAKTLETLTRVLARHVYGLDLTDLPLDRLTEQKAKRRRGNRQAEPSRAGSGDGEGEGAPAGPGRASLQSRCPAPPEDGSETGTGSFRMHESPRKRHDSSGDCLQKSRIPRSASESNLASSKTVTHRRKGSSPQSRRHAAVTIPVLPVSVEQGVARLLASSPDRQHVADLPQRLHRKSHSMDSLRTMRAGTPFQYSESEGPTRTPSPAPSSGVESNSIKDSPMQIDMISADGTSIDLPDGSSLERRSVMAGGSMRGWLPDVAVVLWRRMLGALGDVNHLSDPHLHSKMFQHLIELWDMLLKIRLNQGVSSDNQVTPPPPDLIPPLNIIAPWCFEALTLPDDYHRGKLCAYRLLCQMTLTPHDIPMPRDHLTQFYKVLHHGLVGTDQAVINTLVQFCGPRFFSLMLPGHSLLLLDFIHATNTIVSSSDLREMPRTEAASILGALLCLPTTFSHLPVLQPNGSEFVVMSCNDAKDHILSVLLKCGKREPAGLARCIALSSLGIYLYHELSHETFHPKIKDAVNILLLALRQRYTHAGYVFTSANQKFNHKTVGQVASDLLLLLCDHADKLLEHYSEIPPKIIEVLALTLSSLVPPSGASITERDKHLLTSLMFCLGEWCMRVPTSCLLASQGSSCLLLTVFKVLNKLAGGRGAPGEDAQASQPDLGQDFDPSIQLDNLKEGGSPPSSGRRGAAAGQASPAHGSQCWQSVQLAAGTVLMHLVNHLGHFPMGIGAARLSSMVVEHDDVPGLFTDELSAEVFSAPNIQLFVLSNSLLMSLVELPALEVPGGGVTAGLRTAHSQVRIILRDLRGKACWDASILYCSPEDSVAEEGTESNYFLKPVLGPGKIEDTLMSSSFIGGMAPSSPPQHTLRHRPPDVLPTWDNGAEDMDNLDDLLQYIGHTSPECLEDLDVPRNIPAAPPLPLTREAEEDTITTVLNQRTAEQEHAHKHAADVSMLAERCSATPHLPALSPFQHCRLLFSQLGLAGWEHRAQLHLLAKNEKLLRELRNLDTQNGIKITKPGLDSASLRDLKRCRETHKIAVIYVAEGQEDKNSILSNTCGSHAYEQFIAGLAWEVELESHTGFLGGLQRNKSTGETAPYYATSFVEVIFHVSTRMPSSNQESLLQKTRHLGNDEVHIVWSEHSRDYRRGIIPTEFCDVLIVIYPLMNGLFRVQVSRKYEIPYFGPLFNESIVDAKILPGLVRATAINASHAKRSMLPFYQNYYEERAKSLETVVRNHKEPTTFEEFAAQVYSPVQPASPFYPGPIRASGTSLSSRCPDADCPPAPSSNLAAALLDSHHHHHHRFRFGQAPGPDGRFRGNESGLADGSLHGISPRPLKKLSFKTTARKSLSVRPDSISITPPDSPTLRKSK